MKKTILALSIFAVIFASCKKSSDSTVAPTSSIVGKWYQKSLILTQYDLTGKVIFSENDGASTFTSADYELFNSDLTGKSFDGGDEFDFTYTITGSTIYTSGDAGATTGSMTFVISGSNLSTHADETSNGYRNVTDATYTR